jgi:hypothetical protein
MEHPKPKRIVDKEVIERVRSFGICMMTGRGQCWGHLDVHHVQSVGAGGDDVESNLFLLCRFHHGLIHAKKITPEEVMERKDSLKELDYYNCSMEAK